MNYELLNNNKVEVAGRIIEEPKYSHELFGEGFYETILSVPRLSEHCDKIPVTISERLLVEHNIAVGSEVGFRGQFRSYNKIEHGRSRLMLCVFVREVCKQNELSCPNAIEISGYLCKKPNYRTTPFNREICDLLLAVNRAYNKSDYIPCIAWGRNARFVANSGVGERVFISGRIQSREYEKRYDSGQSETKIAFEVSVNRLEAQQLGELNDDAQKSWTSDASSQGEAFEG